MAGYATPGGYVPTPGGYVSTPFMLLFKLFTYVNNLLQSLLAVYFNSYSIYLAVVSSMIKLVYLVIASKPLQLA